MSFLFGNKVTSAKIIRIDESGHLITFQKINEEDEKKEKTQTGEIMLPAQLIHPISTYKFWNGNIISITCPKTLKKADLHRYKNIFNGRREGKNITAICKRLSANKKITDVRLDPCLKRDLCIYKSGIRKAKLRSPQQIKKYKNVLQLSKLVGDTIILESCFECSEVISDKPNEDNEARRIIRAISEGNLQNFKLNYDKFKIDAIAMNQIFKFIKWLKNYPLPTMQQLEERFTTSEIMSSFLPDKVFHSPTSYISQNVIDFYRSKPFAEEDLDLDNFDAVCRFVASLRHNLTRPPVGSDLESPTINGSNYVGIIQPRLWPENELTKFLLRLQTNTCVVPLGLDKIKTLGINFPNMKEKSEPDPAIENLFNTVVFPHNVLVPLRALSRALHVPKIQEMTRKWYIEGDCEIDNETIRIVFNRMGLVQQHPQTGKSFFGTKEIEEELSKLFTEENAFKQRINDKNLRTGASLQKITTQTDKENDILLLVSPNEEEETVTLIKTLKGIKIWKAAPHPYKDEFSTVNFVKNFIYYITNQKILNHLTNKCLILNASSWRRNLLSRIVYFTRVNNYKIIGHISM